MFDNQTNDVQKTQEGKTQEPKQPKSIYADINADDGTSYEMSKRYKKEPKA